MVVALLFPELPVPWEKPPAAVAVAELPAEAVPEPLPLPLPPDEPSGPSPLVPAPETPGTDSGVADGFVPAAEAEALGSTSGLSPLAKRDFRTTTLFVVAMVLLVPAASVYSYTFEPETGPAVDGGS